MADMSRSSVGLQRAIQTGGKSAGVQYCQDWQKELKTQGDILAQMLRSQKIDNRQYNMKRLELNKAQQELNGCVAIINKKG
jgi:hypothetical protein